MEEATAETKAKMEVTAAEAEEDTEVMADVVTSVYVVSNPRF